MIEILYTMAGALFTGGVIYGGIRADLRNAVTCAIEAKAEAGEAHKRIDRLLLKGNV